jgi:hypothetical protein
MCALGRPSRYTYASIGSGLPEAGNGWRYCLAIPVPDPIEGHTLQLSSLDFIIKYANASMTTHGTFQVDVILTSMTLPTGCSTEETTLNVYRTGGGTYRPFIIDRDIAECLHSESGVKCDDTGKKWRHAVISKSLDVNRAIVHPKNLYMLFHVYEYPTTETVRFLTMDATATWSM